MGSLIFCPICWRSHAWNGTFFGAACPAWRQVDGGHNVHLLPTLSNSGGSAWEQTKAVHRWFTSARNNSCSLRLSQCSYCHYVPSTSHNPCTRWKELSGSIPCSFLVSQKESGIYLTDFTNTGFFFFFFVKWMMKKQQHKPGSSQHGSGVLNIFCVFMGPIHVTSNLQIAYWIERHMMWYIIHARASDHPVIFFPQYKDNSF